MRQHLFEATRQRGIRCGAAVYPRALLLIGVPGGERNPERRGVADPVAGCTAGLLAGILERGDHQRVAEPLDHRGGVAEFVSELQCGRVSCVRKWPRDVDPCRHRRKGRAQ